MSPTVFDFFDLPAPTRRGFVVTAKEDNLSDTIPDFLDTTVLWSDCPAWVKKAFEVRGDFQSYRLVYAKKSGYQLRSFYFAPPITTEEAETPFRTYYETEPSMFWPKVLLSIQSYKRLESSSDAFVSRPRYKEAYQGPTRVRIEEFYSPTPFEIPVYEPMIDRGLNDEIGVNVSAPIILGVSSGGNYWYSVGTLNLEPCLHSAISIGVVLDPPVVVNIGFNSNIYYSFAYLFDGATNFVDWPDEVVIDDRQREVLGGFVRRRVTALSPAITLVITPTSTAISFTLATLGGTVVLRTTNTILSRGVVYALTADDANPEVGDPLTVSLTSGDTTATFTRAVTGLRPSSAYSFKPYAVTSGNITVYGAVTTFTTTALVTDPTSGTPTSGGATLGGTLATQTQVTVTSRGVVYALTATNANPEAGGTGVTEPTAIAGGTAGAFTVAVTGLSYSSAYSYKPWAITTEHGRIYGPVGIFTTPAPTVTVASPTSTTLTSEGATLGGTVTCDPSSFITSRGVVYVLTSVSATPEVNGSGTSSVIVAGTTGTFSQAISGLTRSSAYSFRAWALTAQNVRVYSTAGTFDTLDVAPTVTTPTNDPVTDVTATLGGNVTSDGGDAVTERGVVYSLTATNDDPQISGTGVTKVTTGGTTGVFTVNASSLTPGSEYSYAAYATNGIGTTYTSVETFWTDP